MQERTTFNLTHLQPVKGKLNNNFAIIATSNCYTYITIRAGGEMQNIKKKKLQNCVAALSPAIKHTTVFLTILPVDSVISVHVDL